MTHPQTLARPLEAVTLSDGRRLAYAEYGDPAGTPVVYLTGGQLGRFDGAQWSALAARRGIRLITCDRPGFGQSDRQPDRSLLGWPADLAELLDALGVDHFSLFGLSGGGPHVLVTLYRMGDRVERAAVVSGAPPLTMSGRTRDTWLPVRILHALAQHWHGGLRRALEAQRRALEDPEKFLARMRRALPEPDAQWMSSDPAGARHFVDAGRDAMANGIDGDFDEWTRIHARPWGFPLSSIRHHVRLWYGRADRNVSIHVGRYLAQELPDARMIEVAESGHLSTIHGRIDEILGYLAP